VPDETDPFGRPLREEETDAFGVPIAPDSQPPPQWQAPVSETTWEPQNRALHDRMVRSRVIRT
jgi:hypothetical protein